MTSENEFVDHCQETVNLNHNGATIVAEFYMSGLTADEMESHVEAFQTVVAAIDLEAAVAEVPFSRLNDEAQLVRSQNLVSSSGMLPLELGCTVTISGVKSKDKAEELAIAILKQFTPAAVKALMGLYRYELRISNIQDLSYT